MWGRGEYVRRKAFCTHDAFDDLRGANAHLLTVCARLNATPQVGADGQTAQAILDCERAYLLPAGPPFECGELRELCVDAYSTINVDTCRYSVPEQYVGQRLQVRVYPDRIVGYADGQRVCQHQRHHGTREWSMTLTHYVRTLTRKPGALAGSLALTQIDRRLHALYTTEYHERPKEFIDLLRYMTTAEKGVDEIEAVIGQLRRTGVRTLTTDMVKMVCDRENAARPPHTSTSIDEAASAQLHRLAGLVPNHTLMTGGAVL